MKPEILHNDHMMFLDRALETQRTALLTAMADAVSECRTAADQAAELTETGETGLLRLVEILCAAKVQRGQAGETVLEGTEVQILADVVAQLYDYNVGYDCLLDDGNSVSRKLKKSNEEMEVEEDAIGDR